MAGINQRIERLDSAARRERIQGPETIQRTTANRGGGGAGSSAEWYTVVACPTPANVEDVLNPEGKAFYILRKSGTSYTAFLANTDYNADDLRAYIDPADPDAINYLYKCLQNIRDPWGEAPSYAANTDYWAKQDEIQVSRAIGWDDSDEDSKDIRNYVPQVPVGREVPVIKRTISSVAVYFIDFTQLYTGTEAQRSISWNYEENRIMAVFG